MKKNTFVIVSLLVAIGLGILIFFTVTNRSEPVETNVPPLQGVDDTGPLPVSSSNDDRLEACLETATASGGDTTTIEQAKLACQQQHR